MDCLLQGTIFYHGPLGVENIFLNLNLAECTHPHSERQSYALSDDSFARNSEIKLQIHLKNVFYFILILI